MWPSGDRKNISVVALTRRVKHILIDEREEEMEKEKKIIISVVPLRRREENKLLVFGEEKEKEINIYFAVVGATVCPRNNHNHSTFLFSSSSLFFTHSQNHFEQMATGHAKIFHKFSLFNFNQLLNYYDYFNYYINSNLIFLNKIIIIIKEINIKIVKNNNNFSSFFFTPTLVFEVKELNCNVFKLKSLVSFTTIIILFLCRFILFYFHELIFLFLSLFPNNHLRQKNQNFNSLFNNLPNISIKGIYFNNKGEMKIIEIFTRKDKLIREIKREISFQLNRDIKDIRLIINGHNMSDSHCLDYYHISSSSKVFIMPSLTGGGKKDKIINNKKKIVNKKKGEMENPISDSSVT